MTEKKSILDSQYYPIVFMLMLTVFFVGILSAFYRTTEKVIEQYRQITYKQHILNLFADSLSILTKQEKSTFTDRQLTEQNFEKFVRTNDFSFPKASALQGKYYAVQVKDDMLLGYCFDITGSGLWGTMRGLLAVTPDFTRIINFTIYEQMETPGLGARVEEEWFKKQFAGKRLIDNKKKAEFYMVPEEATAIGNEIRQVTGATITSVSVLKMIRVAAEELNLFSDKQVD